MGKVQLIFVLAVALGIQSFASGMSAPVRQPGFSKSQILKDGFSQVSIPGFSMQQSYSMQFTGSSLGSHSSGVYLNTLSFQFSIPLTLSIDIGLYNLLYASSGSPFSIASKNMKPTDTKPEFLLPRISLDYRPSENLTFSLQLMNGLDAYKAYGDMGSFYSPAYSRWMERR
jgi:hypothetical protein